MSRARAVVLAAWVGAAAVRCGVPDFAPPAAPPEILRFDLTPFEVASGATVTARWATEGADVVTLEGLDPAPRPVPASGSRAWVAEGGRALTLTARGPGGTRRARATLVVEPPPTPVAIERFEVSPRRVRPGDPVQVEWRTVGARAVRLLAGGIDQAVPPVGNRVLRLAPGPVRLLAEGSPGPVRATRTLAPVPRRPIVEGFFADPSTVPQGETTRLRARVDAFDRLQVFLHAPDGSRQLLETRTAADVPEQPSWVSLTTPAVELGTQRYGLVLDSAAGRAEDTALVTGTLDAMPGIDALTVTPTVGGPGGDVTVAWRARGLENLSLRIGNQTVARDLPPSGARVFSLRTGASVARLSGLRAGEVRQAEVPLLVRSAWPTIEALAASRTPEREIFVSWQTVDATDIEVSVDGVVASTSTEAAGALRLPVTGPRTIEVAAANAAGVTRARRTVPALEAPAIERFEIDTATAAVGRWVRVAWATRGAARVLLSAFGGQQRLAAEGETYLQASARGLREVTLDAGAAGGRFAREIRRLRVYDVAGGPREVEPNDTRSAAGGPFAVLPRQIDGELTVGDVDVFRIGPGPDRVEISTGAAPACPEGAALSLWRDLGPRGWARIARVQDPGRCPALSEATAPGLSSWPGPWFVRLEHPGDLAIDLRYRLLVTPLAAQCRDGVVDAREDCDDGGVEDGDGCSAICTFEGLDEVEPNDEAALARAWPGGGATGSLWPDDEDWYAFTVSNPGARAIRLTGQAQPLVARLQLWSADERRLADSGEGLDPHLDGPALVLAAGAYRLRVLAGDGRDGPARGRYRLER